MKGRFNMKQFKKLMLILMCTGVIMGLTACGNDKNADDNGATNNTTTTDNTGKANDTNTNDATDGTGDTNSVTDEIGDDIRDGANDVKDSLDGDNDRNNACLLYTSPSPRDRG